MLSVERENFGQSLYNDSEVQKSMGSVGDDCYNELLSRSLIEKDNVEVNRNFKMQDLIYDLSRLVSGKSSCNIEHGEIPRTACHLTFHRNCFDVSMRVCMS